MVLKLHLMYPKNVNYSGMKALQNLGFANIIFREWPTLENFAYINFRESWTFKNFANINFREFFRIAKVSDRESFLI